MEGCEHKWTLAGRQARRFLGRFRDTATRELLDDLTQEAVVLAWLWSRKATDPSRLGAPGPGIARRGPSMSGAVMWLASALMPMPASSA